MKYFVIFFKDTGNIKWVGFCEDYDVDNQPHSNDEDILVLDPEDMPDSMFTVASDYYVDPETGNLKKKEES